jgi:hypothetical protein
MIVSIKGDCDATSTTGYGRGYFQMDIQIDDASTTIREGCTPGQDITLSVGSSAFQLKVPQSGSVLPVTVNLPAIPVGPSTGSTGSSGGGGSSGGSGGGSGGGMQSITLPNMTTPQPAIMPIPPVNFFGFVSDANGLMPDSKKIAVIGECISDEQVIARAETTFGKGYYDIYIPMDNPATAEDEGCVEDQSVTFDVDGIYSKTIKLPSSGNSIRLDLNFSLEDNTAHEETPAIIKSKPENRAWAFTALAILIMIAIIIKAKERR